MIHIIIMSNWYKVKYLFYNVSFESTLIADSIEQAKTRLGNNITIIEWEIL